MKPKIKIHTFPLTCRAFYPSRSFLCERLSFGDVGRRVCLHSACGAQSIKRNTVEKLVSNISFQRIMTQLFKIIHRFCCEQFHFIFFLMKTTCRLYYCSGGSLMKPPDGREARVHVGCKHKCCRPQMSGDVSHLNMLSQLATSTTGGQICCCFFNEVNLTSKHIQS